MFKKFELTQQFRFVFLFLFLFFLMDCYVFVYNKLLIQNIAGPFLGSPLALTGEILIIAILASVSFVFSQRYQKLYLTFIFGFFSLIYIAVLLYFREFKYFPTLNLLDLAFHEGNVLGDVTDVIISLFKITDLVIPLLFSAWIGIAIFTRGLTTQFRSRVKTCLLCLVATCVLFAFYKTSFNIIYKQISPWHQEIRPNPDLIISHIGLLPFCLEDSISLYKSSHNTKKELTQADKDVLLSYYQSNKSDKNEYTGLFKGFNLFLIQFESLNNIVINKKINDQEITPTLNQLIKEGIYFSEFYTQEGAGPTTSSEFVTQNSIIAPIDTFVGLTYRKNTFQTIANLFNAKGYYTFAIHGNFGSYYNRDFIYKQYGFNDFFSRKDINGHIIHKWIADKDLFSKAAEVAVDTHLPFFAFPITVTSHKNWDILPEFDLYTGSHHFADRAEGYVKNINYSDQALGSLLEKLKKTGLIENTVIMIYGDHGAKLRKDEIESILGYELSDGEFQRWRIQIPFIMWAPKGIIESKIISDVFPQIDVLPTISNLFDLGSHFGIGKDIFDSKNPHIACTNEFAITKNGLYPKSEISKEENDHSWIAKEDSLKDIKKIYDLQFKISEIILKADAIKYLKSERE